MQTNLVGTHIGTYHIRDHLGAGGMGSVYRAYDARHQRMIALKLLPEHLAANPTIRQRFLREAQMAAQLQHPHILPVYDFGEDHGTPFIAMKLVEGGTLDEILKNGPLALPLAARILAQVASALDYAHTQGIIHRDLKPGNILFDREGHLYLGDFGIAHLKQTADILTHDGMFVGTAAYASPEQCRGEDLTPASDIYSLGVVLYEMLTGVLPYRGVTSLAIIHQHIGEAVPNPLAERPELPLGMHEIMRTSLAKLPSVRYQSARSLSRAFNDVLRRELGDTIPAIVDTPPPSPKPTFDNPTAPSAPALPDDLLPDLAPTRPVESIRAPLEPPPAHLLVYGDYPARRAAHRTARRAPKSNHAEAILFGVLLTVLVALVIILLAVVLL